MTEKTALRRAVRYTLLTAGAAAAITVSVPAVAQETGSELDMIVVTGSRIARRDAIAESPILTLDQEAIADSGFVTTEQFLNTMPQIVPGLSSQSNNPSSNGRAFIDLRGLGSNRNLVLIDGRRGMGSTSGGVVDVNTIPSSLIERVEIISGGAASTYGPDAVSGVVNFIMKDSFDGFALDAGYRVSDKSDAEEWSADLTFGSPFADGRGNAVFSAGYFNRDPMYKDARGFSAQASGTTSIFPGGSWSPGTNTPSQAAVDGLFGANLCNTNGGQSGFGFNPDGSLFCTGVQGNSARNAVGFTGPQSFIATQFYPDLFSYNFEPDNLLVLPMERWNLYTHIDLELDEHFKPYAMAMFTNYNALQELAATPAGGTTGFTIPVTNPFIPDSIRPVLESRAIPDQALTFSKRFNDLGGRTGYNTHDVWQLTAGVEGDIVKSWTYDVYYAYGRSVQNEVQGGNVRRDRTQALLNAADGGASLCEGGLNLFGSAPISQACRDYISLEAKNLTTVEQNIAEAVVNGDLFGLPAGMVQAAIGASYRDISFDFQPDGGLQPGLVAGFNQQLPVSGELDYTDVFAEVVVPIIRDFPFIQNLSTNLGYRRTENNIFDAEDTYKATLDWTMVDAVRFRGGFQHAVRSPNIGELFAPQVNNFPTFTNQDPCNTTGAIAATYRNGPNAAQVQALCAAQSAVAGGAAYVQPSSQANGITGGNPDLTPEQSDSWTAGLVFQSPWTGTYTQRLSASVDYWNIELEDVINAVDAQTIVQRCFNRDGANPTFDINNSWCVQFQRDQGNGGVIELQQLQRNQSFIKTSGVDIAFNYGFPVGDQWGDLNFNLVTTYLDKYETQTTSDDPTYNLAGSIGSTTGTAYPEWKGTLNTQWSISDFTFGVTARYIDDMIHGNVVRGSSPVSNTPVDSVWYLDLSARYQLTEQLTLRATVGNVTNTDPELYSPNVQANTDPSTYDILGRRYFFSINYQL